MAHRNTPQAPKSDAGVTLSRRRFLQGGLAAAATAVLALPHGGEAATAQPDLSDGPPEHRQRRRPNFLIILCDEMRFPPVYESDATREFRERYLQFQNMLLANGLDFQRHYTASAACVPARTCILTGHYPSLHGVSQTTGAAKESCEPDVFWLGPDSVPTFGDYFRAAGYRTYWRGKWHASYADMEIPGTHDQLLSFDPDTGAPDPENEALYAAADRLEPYGFSGWIGPEPHGSLPLNSGSSVPTGQQGRDVGFAQQGLRLIQELDHDRSSAPWLVVCSFTNPHDICLWGIYANRDPRFDFHIEENVVPKGEDLFLPEFDRSLNDNLETKPSCQKSCQESYAQYFQPILGKYGTWNPYYRYYYQLHKNVDEQMLKVLQALRHSRFKNDTIVVFTSDHGDLLGAHDNMHQKFYQAYDETVRVPLIIWDTRLDQGPRSIEALTSHIDLAPTLLGLAGIAPEPIRRKLARNHSDARPFVGRDLSPLILGQADHASVNDPVFFMTDDEACRGLNQDNWLGITKDSIVQPNHIETVVARLNDGNVWKYTRYFDNPQFWSSPGTPGDPGVQDVIQRQVEPNPCPDTGPHLIQCEITVKATPEPDEFEMYNVTADPMELTNLYSAAAPLPEQALLEQLLNAQRTQKRLTPCSGVVPGQDCNPWEECASVCSEQ
jgi:choline-sulfatase